MKKATKAVKKRLMSIIYEMASKPELFVKNPGKDFTRNRKLGFAKTLIYLLGMGGGSIRKELLLGNEYATNTATTSAFVQQRDKILPSAFGSLFMRFTQSLSNKESYRGFRLLAMDGSDVQIAADPNGEEDASNNMSSNQLHINALYDLCNNIFMDAILQGGHSANEHAALIQMVDRSNLPDKAIVIADRGLEAYNNMAHIEQKGWNYLFRVKDRYSSGILSGLKLPNTEEFDMDFNRILTRRSTSEIKAQPDLYRFLAASAHFDYLHPDTNPFYPISFRIVRLKISNDTFETLITNLNRKAFPFLELKNLYHLRWGIETAFRGLKYAVGLIAFHSKKAECVSQEIFAALTMYNFSQWIASQAIPPQNKTRYEYRINFSVAVQLCRTFFLSRKAHPPDIEALIRKDLLPIRNNRCFPRNVRTKPAVGFNYRIS